MAKIVIKSEMTAIEIEMVINGSIFSKIELYWLVYVGNSIEKYSLIYEPRYVVKI